MGDRDQLVALSERLASSIAARDVADVRSLLAHGFTQRPAGGDAVETEAFLKGISAIPGEILFVKVAQLTVDVAGDGAIVTGVQTAQLRIDDQVITDRRAFVDWFLRESGEWKLRAAVELPNS